MIARSVDGLVVGPVSDKVGDTVLNDAEAADIPVVFMQRSPGVKPTDYTGKSFVGFVGTADVEGGKTAASNALRLRCTQVGRDDRLAGQLGCGGSSEGGTVDFVAAHCDVTLLQSQYGNEARDAGQKTVENFLSAFPGPGFDGIYSFNDEGALGAVQALKNANALEKSRSARSTVRPMRSMQSLPVISRSRSEAGMRAARSPSSSCTTSSMGIRPRTRSTS